MRVLVVKPSSLGDVVHAFPAVELLRQKVGWESLTWVVNAKLADILDKDALTSSDVYEKILKNIENRYKILFE